MIFATMPKTEHILIMNKSLQCTCHKINNMTLMILVR